MNPLEYSLRLQYEGVYGQIEYLNTQPKTQENLQTLAALNDQASELLKQISALKTEANLSNDTN